MQSFVSRCVPGRSLHISDIHRFLTAKLYLNHLATFDRAKDIKNALQKPLGNLDHTYSQALENLLSQRPDRVRMAKETIKWVSFTSIRLFSPQLEQAVQFGLEGDEFDVDDIVPIHRLMEFTCGFLAQSFSGIVDFIHFTADEFLADIVADWFPEGRYEIATVCLQFLSRPDFRLAWSPEELTSIVRFFKRFPFHEYAARSWALYTRQQSMDEAIVVLALNFLRDRTLVSNAELHLFLSDSHSDLLEGFFERSLTALHMAVVCNVEFLAMRLIEEHDVHKLDVQDHLGRTPLWITAMHGQKRAARTLLDRGASPDIPDASGWTPLLVAIQRYHDSVVEDLVTHPSRAANVNMIGTGTSFPTGDITPLMAAILTQNSFAIRLLLDRPDIEINTVLDGATALSCAALKSNFEGARMLLCHPESNVNEVLDGSSALHTASAQGHTDMVDLLLEHGADVNMEDAEGRTPIMKAVSRGRYQAVSRLATAGASLTTRDQRGWTVLHHTTRTDDYEIPCLLCSYEEVISLIDAQDEAGDTILHLALRWDRRRLAVILAGFGADIDIVSHDGLTARQFAKRTNVDLFPSSEDQGPDTEQIWMAEAPSSRSKLPLRPIASANLGIHVPPRSSGRRSRRCSENYQVYDFDTHN